MVHGGATAGERGHPEPAASQQPSSGPWHATAKQQHEGGRRRRRRRRVRGGRSPPRPARRSSAAETAGKPQGESHKRGTRGPPWTPRHPTRVSPTRLPPPGSPRSRIYTRGCGRHTRPPGSSCCSSRHLPLLRRPSAKPPLGTSPVAVPAAHAHRPSTPLLQPPVWPRALSPPAPPSPTTECCVRSLVGRRSVSRRPTAMRHRAVPSPPNTRSVVPRRVGQDGDRRGGKGGGGGGGPRPPPPPLPTSSWGRRQRGRLWWRGGCRKAIGFLSRLCASGRPTHTGTHTHTHRRRTHRGDTAPLARARGVSGAPGGGGRGSAAAR